eukprot:COSAG01_NODE_2564_length_7448_cov_10.275238_3_plen_248_part_00
MAGCMAGPAWPWPSKPSLLRMPSPRARLSALSSSLADQRVPLAVGAAKPAQSDQRSLPAPLSDYLLEEGLCYLNTATLGPLPSMVVRAVTAELGRLSANPLANYFGGGDEEPATARMDTVRRQCADYMDCAGEELALVPSTTVALNIVAGGLVDSGFLNERHRVLQTDQEHPGGEACWRHYVGVGALGGIDRVEITPSPESSDEVVAAFAAAFERAPEGTYRVLSVSHVLTTSGVVRLPLCRFVWPC